MRVVEMFKKFRLIRDWLHSMEEDRKGWTLNDLTVYFPLKKVEHWNLDMRT